MENKKYKNKLIYFLTILVVVIVYLIIHFYGNIMRDEILLEKKGYENDVSKPPVNNIISIVKKDEVIAVDNIKLSTNKITMKIGKKVKISAIVEPYNATNKDLIWESSNSSIARVDRNGNITALREGEVTITVRTKDGLVRATCVVKVEPVKVDEIKLNPASLSLKVNTSTVIVPIIKPYDAIDEQLIWESSDPSIATVDSNGKVTGVKEGNVIITAKTKDGKVNGTCSVKIVNDTIPVTKIKLDHDNLSIKIGSSSQIIATIEPKNATERDLIWESSDPRIVKVDDSGKITGVNVGTVTITVKTKDGTVEATCVVKVEPIDVDKIILNTNEMTLKVNDTEQLTAIVEPDNATDPEIIWTSSDPKIATVDENGNVTAVKPGEVIITAKTKDGDVKEECKVIIKDNILFTYEFDDENYIYLINQFPIKDSVGKSLHGDKHTQDFKLRLNSEAAGVKFVITMEKLDGSDLREDWVKAYLVHDGVDIDNCYRNNGSVKTFDEYKNYKDNPREKIIYEGTITSTLAARGYEDYTFRMWVSEDVKLNNDSDEYEDVFSNRTFKARINVYAFKDE